MNVFILSTGRSGTTTFVSACADIENYTAGHETRTSRLFAERFAYPDNHIEADNRLSWLLGRLDQTYGDRAFYVHLIRDRDATAASYNKRWEGAHKIMPAYSQAILMGNKNHGLDACLDYYDTVNSNITLFLRDKTRKMTFRLENAEADFQLFWQHIGARGNLQSALDKWRICFNPQDGAAIPASSRFQDIKPAAAGWSSLANTWSVTVDKPADARRLLEMGHAEYRAGRMSQALDYFMKARALDPDNPTILNNLGIVYDHLRDFRGALRSFEAAHQLNPGDPITSGNLVSLLLRARMSDKAATIAMAPGSSVPYPIAVEAVKAFINTDGVRLNEGIKNELDIFELLCQELGLQNQPEERTLSLYANYMQPKVPWREQALDQCTDAEFGRWVELSGVERLRQHLASGKGAILLSSHLASGRLTTLTLSRLGLKLTSLENADHLGNYRIDAIKTMDVLELQKAEGFSLKLVFLAKKALQNGGIFHLAGDGYKGTSGIEVEFLGRARPFRTGFAELALMTGVPVFPVFSLVGLDGKNRLELLPPLDAGSPEMAHGQRVEHLIRQYVKLLEDCWRANPANVTWGHIRKHLNIRRNPGKDQGNAPDDH